jgi:ribosomal protein S8
MQNINLFLELLLVLIAILASNGILYSLKFLNKNKKNKKNYFKIVYLKINKTGKDVLTPMVLISSNPI